MRKLLPCLLVLWTSAAHAQNPAPLRHLNFHSGFSHHYRDGLNGFGFGGEYGKSFRSRYRWIASLDGTYHFGTKYIPGRFLNNAPPQHLISAGVNGSFLLQPSIFRTLHHDLAVGAGVLLRFETSNEPRHLGTGIDRPTRLEPGYRFRLVYDYTFTNRVLLGVQYDWINPFGYAVISYAGLRVGKRF